MRPCDRCSNPYEPKKSNQRYCGTQCRNLSMYHRHRDKIIARATAHKRAWRDQRLLTVLCKCCGKEFQQARYGEECCSRKCAVRHWRDGQGKDKYRSAQKRAYHKARQTTPWRQAIDGAISRAKKSGAECNITKGWAKAVWTGRCAVTDLPFKIGATRAERYFSASLDRINPKKGYTKDNCRFVLWGVNVFKSDATDEDMLLIARAMVKKYGMA